MKLKRNLKLVAVPLCFWLLASSLAFASQRGHQKGHDETLHCKSAIDLSSTYEGVKEPSTSVLWGEAIAKHPRFERLGNLTIVDYAKSMENSGRLLWTEGAPHPDGNSSFHASNEGDWFNAPYDREPVDVVLGFGTNSAWDIAVRKNAGQLIVADWDLSPLYGQEFFLRPLLLRAKSRAQFFYGLVGLTPNPLVEAFPNPSIDMVMNDIYERLGSLSESTRQQEMEAVLETLAQDESLTPQELRAIQAYYEFILEAYATPVLKAHWLYDGYLMNVSRGGPVPELRILGPYFDLFSSRYSPSFLIGDMRANPALVKGPNFSAFSSEEEFRILQQLFKTIQYVHAPYDSPGMLTHLAGKFPQKKFSVSITNIMDCMPGHCAEGLTLRYLDLIKDSLGKAGPVTVFRTRGKQIPHIFERFSTGDGVDSHIATMKKAVANQMPPELLRLLQSVGMVSDGEGGPVTISIIFSRPGKTPQARSASRC